MKAFLARQPIFTQHKSILGYELLCRTGPENFFSGGSTSQASIATVDEVFLFGLNQLTQGRLAFINCTREFLIRDYLTLLPRDLVVAEILESVRPDPECLEACRRLKSAGYRIALDDFVDTPAAKPFTELADFIKVDFQTTSPPEIERLAREYLARKIDLVAERVETHEMFKQGVKLGYMYFQGYFFCRPEMVERRDIPVQKLNCLRILSAVNQTDIDLKEVSESIKREPSLSYRLLRYLNSPIFALRMEVHSIPHALSLLGEGGLRKWVSLVSVATMGEDKPSELLMVPLVRARFCELLAPLAGMRKRESELFLMGLLSAMDAMLDMPLSKVLAEVPVKDDIKQALLGAPGALRSVYEVAVNYEMGTWEGVGRAAASLKMKEDSVPDLYMKAFEWGRDIMEAHETPSPHEQVVHR
jgi:c-di-GMP-related signal transduction protein